MPKTESKIVKSIIDGIRKEWPLSYVRKINDRHTRGIPDIVAQVSDGVVSVMFWIEVKTPDGVVSKIQKLEHESIERAGGIILVVTSFGVAFDLIRYHLTLRRLQGGHKDSSSVELETLP